jgi:hypothetical protein
MMVFEDKNDCQWMQKKTNLMTLPYLHRTFQEFWSNIELLPPYFSIFSRKPDIVEPSSKGERSSSNVVRF